MKKKCIIIIMIFLILFMRYAIKTKRELKNELDEASHEIQDDWFEDGILFSGDRVVSFGNTNPLSVVKKIKLEKEGLSFLWEDEDVTRKGYEAIVSEESRQYIEDRQIFYEETHIDEYGKEVPFTYEEKEEILKDLWCGESLTAYEENGVNQGWVNKLSEIQFEEFVELLARILYENEIPLLGENIHDMYNDYTIYQERID